MILLAIETSTTRGGVALTQWALSEQSPAPGALSEQSPTLLALTEWERGKSHSELLTSAIESSLHKAGITLDQVDAFAVDQGPGSFTGIRVGINAARALGFAGSKPVVPVSSLEILAHGTPVGPAPLLCLTNAHKNLLFKAVFQPQQETWVMVEEPHVVSIAQLEQDVQTAYVCVGDGFPTYQKFFSERLRSLLVRDEKLFDEPRALSLAQLAVQRLKSGSTFDWNNSVPLYLRASEAEEKLKG